MTELIRTRGGGGVVVHGSGVYFEDGSEPVHIRELHSVGGDEDLRDIIIDASTL